MKRSRLIALMQKSLVVPDEVPSEHEVSLYEVLEVVTAAFKSEIDYRKEVMNPLFLDMAKMMNHLSERMERIERHTLSPVYQALIEDDADDAEQDIVAVEAVEEIVAGDND